MTAAMVLGQAATDTGSVVAFHPHLDTLGLVIALVLGYEFGLRKLAAGYAPRGEEPVGRLRRLAFYGGILLMFAVSSWPVHDIGERSLFMFHMVEHMTLALVVPLMLLWGTPWWLLRAVLLPILPVVRVLTKPIVALLLFNATLV